MAVTVLIVDDDARFRDLARRILTSWGYQPESEAGSVTEALQQVTRSVPDVALVDIGLPDGNGLELSKVLAGDPWRMRVILTSSDGDALSAQEATAAGAVAFVPKAELSSPLLHSIIGDG
ncbi:response regulator [Leifsonia sp. YIM 134122]|uniref:Response regulator n=1 Tax=Leifsonia stereocauli TaxID=3134136 RepID=A0ABU9VZ34_9MICO